MRVQKSCPGFGGPLQDHPGRNAGHSGAGPGTHRFRPNPCGAFVPLGLWRFVACDMLRRPLAPAAAGQLDRAPDHTGARCRSGY